MFYPQFQFPFLSELTEASRSQKHSPKTLPEQMAPNVKEPQKYKQNELDLRETNQKISPTVLTDVQNIYLSILRTR